MLPGYRYPEDPDELALMHEHWNSLSNAHGRAERGEIIWTSYFNRVEAWRTKYMDAPTQGSQWDNRRKENA